MNNYAIEMRGITKRFGSLVANDNIDLLVNKNTIHGIIGENGAGKSTLMSILFGLYNPDHGSILINGEEVFIKTPHDARRYRIGMVHQHFKLVGIYNAVDNIILGNEMLVGKTIVNRSAAKAKIASLAKRYEFNIDLTKPVERLSVGQQQKIEILKTLFLDSDILIFDEPTAVLTPKEIDGFLKLLTEFRNEGKTIIIITHKLEEIKAVCSEATVIRRGKLIERVNVAQTSATELARLMVGTEVTPTHNSSKRLAGDVLIDVVNVSTKRLKKVSFKVHEAEIVAIAGVEGNGQTDLINIITGLEKLTTGHIFYNKTLDERQGGFLSRFIINKARHYLRRQPKSDSRHDLRHMSIRQRNLIGLAHIPEDRHRHGLVLDMKLKYALAIKTLNRFSRLGIINEKLVSEHAKAIINKYDVRGAHSGEAIARQLSGGNQQKAIIGRELESSHNFVVVAQPTRGLDVGAIKFVHDQIIAEKEKGNGVLLVSYELSEVMALADRIIVVNNGAIIGDVNARTVKREEIGLLMAGIKITTSPLGGSHA